MAAHIEKTPFKFLDPYEKKDKAKFFGREEETEQLYEMTHQTNLVLLYGQSGTGKTSLIKCGLANRFSVTDWLGLYIRRQQNINDSLHQDIRNAATSPIAGDASIQKAIRTLYRNYMKPIYLVFDQFEELYILGHPEEQNTFVETISGLLDSDLPCKVILVMREEYIARLNHFEKTIPTLFNKRLRVEHMKSANLERVITGTVEKTPGIQLENGATTARNIIDKLNDGEGVQLAYLQVYLETLNRTASNNGSSSPLIFSDQLVNEVGELGDVLATFLETQKKEIQQKLAEFSPKKDAIQIILEEFITSDETKQPVAVEKIISNLPSISQNPGMSSQLIKEALSLLDKSRLLRDLGKERYELSHDALGIHIARGQSQERKDVKLIHEIIRDGLKSHQKTGAFLSEEELVTIRQFRDNLMLDEKEEVFLKDSEENSKTKKNDEKKRKRNRNLLIIFFVIAIIGWLVWINWQLETENEKITLAHAATANRLLREGQIDLAAYWALQSHKKFKDLEDNSKYKQPVFEVLEKSYWKTKGDTVGDMYLERMLKHQSRVNALIPISKDGKFVSGSDDGSVHFWQWDSSVDSAKSDTAKSLQIETGIESIASHPQKDILALSDKEGKLYVWDWKNKKPMEELPLPGTLSSQPFQLDFDPDDHNRIIAAGQKGAVLIWEKDSDTQSYSPKSLTINTLQNGRSSSLEFSALSMKFASQNRVIIGGVDVDKENKGIIDFFRLQNNTLIQKDRRETPGRVKTIAINDGEENLLVAAGGDWKSLRLGKWKASSPKPDSIREIKHKHFVTRPRKKMIFQLSEESLKNLKSEKLSSGEMFPANIIDILTSLKDVVFETEAIFLDTLKSKIGNEQIKALGSLILKQAETNMEKKQAYINTLAFNVRSNVLASGGSDGTIRLWNTSAIKKEAETKDISKNFYLIQEPFRPFQHRWILSLVFINDNTLIAGSADHTLRTWIIDDKMFVNYLQPNSSKK